MNIEQIKEILAGAPDGATHYIETEFSTFYLKDDDTGFYVYENNQWKRDYVEDFGVTESLLPLRTILTLHEEIERLKQANLKALELLDATVCPCCDKTGAYYDKHGDVCQCQWCYEVDQLREQSK